MVDKSVTKMTYNNGYKQQIQTDSFLQYQWFSDANLNH